MLAEARVEKCLVKQLRVILSDGRIGRRECEEYLSGCVVLFFWGKFGSMILGTCNASCIMHSQSHH